MRKVRLDVSKFGLVVGAKIKLELINSIGKLQATTSGYSLDKSIIIENITIIEVKLLESDLVDFLHFYKITLNSELSFTFRVPTNDDSSTHDLISLFKLSCYKGIINQDNKSLSPLFTKKLDFYFSGENPHFTKVEKDIVQLYEYYANDVINGTATIDIMKMMDQYLSKIGF